MLVKALEARDPYSAHHSENVMYYAVSIAEAMGLAPQFIHRVRNAAMLHDIGKIGVPDRVLKKTGRLKPSEWELMKQHPLISAEILGQLTVLKREVLFVRHHHERFDGRGYPEGLSGKQIPIGARVLAVADSFDAITSDRLYRAKKDRLAAITEISSCSGSQFDPEVVEAFLRVAESQGNTWPINPRAQARAAAGQNGRSISDLITPANRNKAEDWIDMQQQIEEALSELTESFDKLTNSRSSQDLDRLTHVVDQFRNQAEELSALAQSVPDKDG